MLELWHQLAVESGTAVKNEAVRKLLAGIKGSNKTAKAAKALVALAADQRSDHASRAANASLASLIERALRWSSYDSSGRH